MDAEGPYARFGFLVMAAVAGAISSLYAQQWRKMTPIDILLSIIASMSFALIAVPWLLSFYWKIDAAELRPACAITYLGALAAHVAIPRIIRLIKERMGDKEETGA